MCMFILNDINDIERDRINHPKRPLPVGSITVETAAVVYLTLFSVSHALVWVLIETSVHYIYLLGFLLAINYNTVVDYLPRMKNVYVALTSLVPVIIVNTAASARLIPISIAVALFLFVFGREILMDLQDSSGDGLTLAKALPARTATTVAFVLQGVAILMLGFHLSNPIRIVSLALIFLLYLVILLRWGENASRQLLINLMKLELLASLAFLF